MRVLLYGEYKKNHRLAYVVTVAWASRGVHSLGIHIVTLSLVWYVRGNILSIAASLEVLLNI